MTFTDDQITELIATADAMREQLGEDYPKVGSILDLWFRSADALAQVKAERDEERAKVLGLGFSLEGTQAENSALRDAIRDNADDLAESIVASLRERHGDE